MGSNETEERLEIAAIELVELVELEVFCLENAGRPAPHARHYVIRVDKQKFTVHEPCITGRAILELAGKVPVKEYKLTQKHHGGAASTIGENELVDFRAPGVERFMTMKLDQTEG